MHVGCFGNEGQPKASSFSWSITQPFEPIMESKAQKPPFGFLAGRSLMIAVVPEAYMARRIAGVIRMFGRILEA
jgi:hypothetical protein